MNGNHVVDNDYSSCLFSLFSYFLHTRTHTYIQNQKGSVMVEDKVKNKEWETSADEERNSEKKGKEKKEDERACFGPWN